MLLTELPDDDLYSILRLLSPQDLLSIRSTCKRLLCIEDMLWRGACRRDFWAYDLEEEETYRKLYFKYLSEKWSTQRKRGMWRVLDYDVTAATHILTKSSPNRVALTIESQDRIGDWANFIQQLNHTNVKIIDLHVDTSISELSTQLQFDIKGLFKFNLHIYKTSDDKKDVDKVLQVINAFWPQRSAYSGPMGALLLQESELSLDGCRALSEALWDAGLHPSLMVCYCKRGSAVGITDDLIVQIQNELRLRNCCFDWREISSG